MLANGQGKARANKEGNAKAIREWRLSFLSTGELTLADKIAEDGQGQAMAGHPSGRRNWTRDFYLYSQWIEWE